MFNVIFPLMFILCSWCWPQKKPGCLKVPSFGSPAIFA
jgi:hypothetical protein